jgi:hypothetical protein
MTTLYKLTDKDGQTYGNTQWGEGITHTAPGTGALCTNGWIHAYTDPLLAVFLNPLHCNFPVDTMRLWECEGEVGATDHGLKVGCASLTTLHEMPVPQVTTEQLVRFAVLCSLTLKTRWKGKAAYRRWANAWLDGTDRSEAAARAAAWAARAAARVAARAAREAARAAAAEAARAAAEAAEAAAWAAEAAAGAAEEARAAAEAAEADIDLIALAHEAVGV